MQIEWERVIFFQFRGFDWVSLYTALQEDVDERFDSSLFKVPQNFIGSFQLPNLVFTKELFNMSSENSQELVSDIKEKVCI